MFLLKFIIYFEHRSFVIIMLLSYVYNKILHMIKIWNFRRITAAPYNTHP